MSYYIYQTEGIIVDKKDVGEADRIFAILTRDFGRIMALAKGVRYIKSKLRHNLNTFSYSRFGLVMGRDFWRIVDAEELNGWRNIRRNPEKLALVSKIAELINRMVKGEQPDLGLWEEIKKFFLFLEESESPKSEEDLKTFELLTGVRIMSHLGYVADHEKWLSMTIEEARKKEKLMADEIKKALDESHL